MLSLIYDTTEPVATDVALEDLGCSGEPGSYKCGQKYCQLCNHILEGDKVTSSDMGSDHLITLRTRTTCESDRCVYLVTCGVEQCGWQCVGRSVLSMRKRHSAHRLNLLDF